MEAKRTISQSIPANTETKEVDSIPNGEVLVFDLFDPGYSVVEVDGDLIFSKTDSDIVIRIDCNESFIEGNKLLLSLEQDIDQENTSFN